MTLMTNTRTQKDLHSPRASEPSGERPPVGSQRVSRSKKVAFVQTQAENAGAQEIARQLAHGAERNGWQARQVFFFRRTEAFDDEDNVFFCARQRPSSPFEILKLFVELYKEFRRFAPDAVVTFQHYGNLIAAPVARLAGVRLIIANQVSSPELIADWVRRLDRWFGQIGFFDRIVVNSATTETIYSSYPFAYTKRIVQIDHGFCDKSAAMDKAEARRQLGLPPSGELLGCAARLQPVKQIDLAMRVLAINHWQHLLVAGQGPDLPRLEALAVELGLTERVHFVGELDTPAMGVFLSALDCFVFPSAMETFGLAPIEAAQAGAPVVANDLEALRDGLAVDGEPCALFVDARDTAAFAAAVRRVCEDKALAGTLTARGRKLKERFPLDKMVDDYMKLLEATPN